jgi:hypothetical protein
MYIRRFGQTDKSRGGFLMATQVLHPKNGKRCAFCKRWNGNANLTFKNPQAGFEYMLGVYGKCMANNSNQPSSGGTSCPKYEPNVEAYRLL